MARKPEMSSTSAYEIFEGHMSAEPTLSADLDTISVAADEAPFVRRALVRAQTLRLIRSDPGDAYLEGVTDALNFKHLQEQADQLGVRIAAVDDVTPSAEAA